MDQIDHSTVLKPGHLILDQLRASMCTGKDRHATEDQAMTHVEKVAARWGDTSLHVYQCVFCNGYHVGKVISPERAAFVENALRLDNVIDYDFEEGEERAKRYAKAYVRLSRREAKEAARKAQQKAVNGGAGAAL